MFIVPISQMPSISSLGQAEVASTGSAIGAEIPFSDVFKNAFESVADQSEISAQDSYDLAFGNSDDLHNVMIHSQIAATTLELTVQLTSKALNAYKEIMNMQV